MSDLPMTAHPGPLHTGPFQPGAHALDARQLDAEALREWAQTAVTHLIAHADEINELNVFPVADCDTGTNMLFTMRAAGARAQALTTVDVGEVAAALAEGALQGARGNSGVILSQILRGLADVTAEPPTPRHEIGAHVLADALRHAVTLAGESVGEAVPGTIVSVLAASASAAEQAVPPNPVAVPSSVGTAEVVVAAAEAAVVALERTTEQLDVLADAGVVDAGGRGLLVLLDALVATLTGHTPARTHYRRSTDAPGPTGPVGAAPPHFEVMYLLDGCASADVDTLRARLDALGESVAIAASGTAARYSVHVHADDAGAAVEAGLAVGALSRIQITALSGIGAHPSGGWTRERAVLALVDGDGAAELFSSEGAHVLRPEDDRPITAQQVLRALVDTGAAQVMLLPNGYVAAEELVAGCTAASGWGIDVVPVPAGSMVQGLAALAVHDPARHAVDDGYTMARAAAAARLGSVRVATEDALTWAGACHPGDGLGIAGDEVLIVGRDVTAAAAGLIDLLLGSGGELVTVLTGDGVDPAVGPALGEHVRHRHIGAELVTYRTGHGGDALLIGVE